MATIKTAWFVPRGFDALAFGDTIYLRRGLTNPQPGILAHEAVHLEQQARIGKWRFAWRYLTDADFRVACEVEAYRVSMAHGMSLEDAAKWLCKYDDTLKYTKAMGMLANVR